jgi:trimeric autotransporter adhesin
MAVERPNVQLNGIVNTVAGNGAAVFGAPVNYGPPPGEVSGTYSGDGGAATNAGLNYPYAVAVDAAGDLFIADTGNNRIRKVDTNGIITTAAGNGTNGFSGDGGAATNATLNAPSAVTVDAVGDVFFTDAGNSSIRKVDTNGIITTVAGNGTNGDDFHLGSVFGEVATNVSLSYPNGVVVDAAGNLYIANAGLNCISKLSTNGILTTVAGEQYLSDNGLDDYAYPGFYYTEFYYTEYFSPHYSGDGGPAFTAGLDDPTGMAVDPAGNLFIADTYNQRIRKVSTNSVSVVLADQYFQKGGQVISSDIITTVAGGGSGGLGGSATSAGFYYPWSVAADTAGNLFIGDSYQLGFYKVDTNGIITNVAGNGTIGYSGDGGAATNASFHGSIGFGSSPASSMFNGLAVDAAGNLFIADTYNNRIRKVTFSKANLLANGSLVLNNVSPADAGNYSVIVTSASGSVTSSVVAVKLQLPPITPTFMASNGLCAFTWSAVSNQTYQLQCATNLISPSWIDLGSPITATNNSVSATDVIGVGGQRFYRVRLWP